MTFLILIGVTTALSLGLLVTALAMSRQPQKVNYVDRLKKAQAGTAQGIGKKGLRDADEMNKSIVDRLFIPLADKYGKMLASVTPSNAVARYDQLLMEAGMDNKMSGAQVTTISLLLAIAFPAGAALLLMPHVAKGLIELWMYLGMVALSGAIGFQIPSIIIGNKARARKHEIQLALPFTFDLISISVSAGMAFEGAMAVVAERTRGALSDELRRTIREINLGIAQHEALSNLSKRSGVDDLRTFITAVNYIKRLGGSLTNVIKIQTEAMRTKRRQKAEEKANQAPVKIMIPLVLFIFPVLFIVILGPAGLKFLV